MEVNAGDTSEEIKTKNTLCNSCPTKNSTLDDYMVRALSMPPDFGTISKGIY